jgi:hypothetical protein
MVEKRIFCRKFPVLKTKIAKKKKQFKKKIAKNRHNCRQYERLLKVFCFHILNIAKIG